MFKPSCGGTRTDCVQIFGFLYDHSGVDLKAQTEKHNADWCGAGLILRIKHVTYSSRRIEQGLDYNGKLITFRLYHDSFCSGLGSDLLQVLSLVGTQLLSCACRASSSPLLY